MFIYFIIKYNKVSNKNKIFSYICGNNMENKTPKYILDAIKRYNKRHPDRIAKYQKKYNDKNKEKLRKKGLEYYQTHKEQRKEYSREHRLESRNNLRLRKYAYLLEELEEGYGIIIVSKVYEFKIVKVYGKLKVIWEMRK